MSCIVSDVPINRARPLMKRNGPHHTMSQWLISWSIDSVHKKCFSWFFRGIFFKNSVLYPSLYGTWMDNGKSENQSSKSNLWLRGKDYAVYISEWLVFFSTVRSIASADRCHSEKGVVLISLAIEGFSFPKSADWLFDWSTLQCDL